MASSDSDKDGASVDFDPPEYVSMLETPVISHAGDGQDSEGAEISSLSHMEQGASVDGDFPEYVSMLETTVISHAGDDGQDSEGAEVPSLSHMEQGLSEENYAAERKYELLFSALFFYSLDILLLIFLCFFLGVVLISIHNGVL
ncbi:hypothetical protein PMKS-002550 [Pichia membranifaciens]|uniref:Uncharacterized protein n=1 Tax=Pichia membranifaciens TaxID=4926 RepID=A0A1Q2YHW3_9ASCO|nr:hypothetical protein PMKS-002550 [Pichia membranifaciens]